MFQLENLTLTFMPFVFFDLRAERTAVHPEIDPLLARAEGVAPARVLERLGELGVPKNIPVVLVSEDGRSATQLYAPLERAGFAQVYVVEGGVRGLVAEVGA